MSEHPARRGELSRTEMLAISLLVATVFGQAIVWGANNNVLAAAAAFAQVVCAIAVALLLGRAGPGFNRVTALPTLLAFLVFALGCAGLLAQPRQDWAGPVLAAAGASALSIAPDATLLELAKLAGAGALALAAARIGERRRRLHVAILALLMAGAAYTVLSLFLWNVDQDRIWGAFKGEHRWRFTATFLNGNAAGCFLSMLLVLAVDGLLVAVRAMRHAPPGLKGPALQQASVLGACVFIFTVAAAATLSRSALLASAAAILLILLWPSRRRAGRRRRRAARILAPLGGAALLALMIGGGLALAGGQTLSRMETLRRDADTRLDAYRLMVEDLRQAPEFGYGLGAFPQVLSHGRTLAQAEAVWNFRAAHNAVLHTALEGGAPMTALIALLFVVILYTAVRAGERASFWGLRRGLVAALLVVLTCASVDIALNVPAIAALSLTLAGLSLGGAAGALRGGR
ncbi:MAG: O-antigen ligase family protein [Brevundimonas aurantiaca]